MPKESSFTETLSQNARCNMWNLNKPTMEMHSTPEAQRALEEQVHDASGLGGCVLNTAKEVFGAEHAKKLIPHIKSGSEQWENKQKLVS